MDRRDRLRAEEGFTLIELMIVVLILAILITIAAPSYLASRNRAQDRAAQSIVRLGLNAQLVHYAGEEEFSGDNAVGGDLDAIEPEVAWGTIDTSSKGAIATITSAGNTTILRSQSSTGTIFCLGRTANGATAGTYYRTGCTGLETQAAVSGWATTAEAGW